MNVVYYYGGSIVVPIDDLHCRADSHHVQMWPLFNSYGSNFTYSLYCITTMLDEATMFSYIVC